MQFKSIIGQNKAKNILRNHLNEGMVYHTYLFYGPQGLGKTTMAKAFAKALLCSNGEEDSCGECSACQRFASGNHPDYLEVEPQDGVIGIDAMREIRRTLSYRPYEADYRIIVIKDIEYLTLEAANSILKTLEEPPEFIVIILISNNKQVLLLTIESRALAISFEPLASRLILKALSKKYPDDERLPIVVALAAGSLGLAQDLMSDEELFAKRVELLEKLSSLEKDSFLAVFELVKWIEANWNDRYELFFYILQLWYNDLISSKLNITAKIINKDFLESLELEASLWDLGSLQEIILAIEEARNRFFKNINRQLILEVLLLKINSWRK